MKTKLIAIGIMLGFFDQWNITKAENTGTCIDIQDQAPFTTTTGNCTGAGTTCGGSVTVTTGNTDDFVCVFSNSGDYSSCVAGTVTGELSVQIKNCVEDPQAIAQVNTDETDISAAQGILFVASMEDQDEQTQQSEEGERKVIADCNTEIADLNANAPCVQVASGAPSDGGAYTALANTGDGTCTSCN